MDLMGFFIDLMRFYKKLCMKSVLSCCYADPFALLCNFHQSKSGLFYCLLDNLFFDIQDTGSDIICTLFI